MKKALLLVAGLLVAVSLACGFSASTANISEAKMAKDAEGNEPTTVFGQEDAFYVVVELLNAPDDTTVKAQWVAVDAEGIEAGLQIDEAELTSGSETLQFDLTNDKLWPSGKYKVDLYLNDELDRTLEFEVEGEAVATEPEPTGTPEPEPTGTPEPAPTDTPEPELTDTPKTSAGDSLGGSSADEPEAEEAEAKPTPTPTEESVPKALPLQAEAYVHPSGAFTFGVPKGWELHDEDELSGAYGDRQSRVGAIFVNFGYEMNEKELKEFIDNSLDIIIGTFSEDYEVASENNQLEESGLYYVGASFDAGDGWANIFYEPRDTVIFMFYFASLDYDAMEPTWSAIIDTYDIDVDAALAVAPTEEAAPVPTQPPPTKAPAPPPGPSVPAGKAILLFRNNTGVDFVLDVIGPTNTSQVVPPGAEHEFVIDPGHYTLNGHSPGGQYAINAYEFDIAAGQVFPLNLN